jgi:hypothetical protein
VIAHRLHSDSWGLDARPVKKKEDEKSDPVTDDSSET